MLRSAESGYELITLIEPTAILLAVGSMVSAVEGNDERRR
jgi:hypothetical protein